MDYATRGDFSIVTRDLDFGALLAATHAVRPSVIQLRLEDVSPEAAGELVLDALARTLEMLERGALVIIHENRVRTRLLPLKTTVHEL